MSESQRSAERDPLLRDDVLSADATTPTKDDRRRQVGPLEISRSARYGILAGVWSATFLSVSEHDIYTNKSLTHSAYVGNE